MRTNSAPSRLKLLSAYAVIYFVWGSTYYAIRVGVLEVPPFLLASMRFALAGFLLFVWGAFRGVPLPTSREWRSITFLASLLFVLDYGLLFWAEQRVPSGVAAIMLATIPAFMALFEILLLRTQRMTARLTASLLLGLGGVFILTIRSLRFGGNPIDSRGALALIIASVSWSFASVFSKKLYLPDSKSMSSGSQMLVGGLLLSAVAAVSGEFRRFHPLLISRAAWLALIYLILAGSVLGFTAYVWLLHYEPPTKVGTYAYVNPVVAVILGCFVGGERLNARLVLGMLLVLMSVILITGIRSVRASGTSG